MKFLRFAALSLLILYPFVKFATFNNYPLASLEIGLIVLGALLLSAGIAFIPKRPTLFAAVGSFVLFFSFTTGPTAMKPLALILCGLACFALFWILISLKEKSAVLLALFAAGMILGEVAVDLTQPANDPTAASSKPVSSKNQGNVLYLILDEHIGIDGMPASVPETAATQEALRQFYLENRFTLYSKAYSNYFYTDNAISNILNTTYSKEQGSYFSDSSRRLLKQNRLFESFKNQEYQIYAYSFGYIDYCTEAVDHCYTHAKNSPTSIQDMGYPMGDRLRILGSLYLATNSVFKEIQKRIPDTGIFITKLGPLQVVPNLFNELKKDLNHAPQNTLFFVHVMMPHYPYVYGADCAPKPISEWQNRNEFNEANRKNSPEGYARRYRDYYDQIGCLNRLIGSVLESLKQSGHFDETTIVIHGDHGSRINLGHDPYFDFSKEISVEDMITSHSALLAVKPANAAQGRIDSRQGSVTRILNSVLYDQKPFSGEDEHFVLMKQKEGKKELMPFPMPAF